MFKYVFAFLVAAVFYFAFLFNVELTNEVIGKLFVTGIFCCLALFLLFKFGLHYKILGLNRFTNAFYYSVFEYKKAQTQPSGLTYGRSVREQAEVALAANFDPTLKTADLKVPSKLYSGKDAYLTELREKIRAAEQIKLEARHLDRKAKVLLEKTKDELEEKELVDKSPTGILDRFFQIENGVAAAIDLTVDEIRNQGYHRTPDYEIITQVALDENPYFARTFRYFDSEDILGVLFRAPFMIILIGIIGTFAGFYLALSAGGDIKSGASVAIVSSLVGLPVSLFMEYLNTLFPDEGRYRQAFNKFKVTLEMLFNHEQELNRGQTQSEVEAALAKAEEERLAALAEQEAELQRQRLVELTTAQEELKEKAEGALAKAEQERAAALAKAEQEGAAALAKQEAALEKEKELALAKAEHARVEALAKQQAEFERQKRLDLTKAEKELKDRAEAELEKLKKETELALAKAEKELDAALAKQAADFEKQRELDLSKVEQELKKQTEGESEKLRKEAEKALAKAQKERDKALAQQEAELKKQVEIEVAKAEQELQEKAERDAEKLMKEKELAVQEAALAHQAELAAQLAAMEEEHARILAEQEEVFTKKLNRQKKILAGLAEEIS